ncbi:cytochrome P450 7B1 [Engraulis encrasicolus]|uniref:cytochrome P450 7B1 n=1 Tax=Engraulis encrasicolus TaxID=184585 RepID=UPI002FD78C19
MLELVLTVVLVLLSLLYLLTQSFGRTWREGEPPLVKGCLPFVGKAVEFGQDALRLLTQLQDTHGDIFTVLIAGRYMTFVMNPLWYPAVVKHARQLDFHVFTDKVAPPTFGYPPVHSGAFPGLSDRIQSSFQLLQGDQLTHLSQSMMGNLLATLRQHLMWPAAGGRGETEAAPPDRPGLTREMGLYALCESLMFHASILTLYGKHDRTHSPAVLEELRGKFSKFDASFPLLVGGVPIWLLVRTNALRGELIKHFDPRSMQQWSSPSEFITTRAQLLDEYRLTDMEKGAHHFAILWASVGNTVPAAFWVMYHLLAHPEAFAAVKSEIQEVLGIKGEGLSLNDDLTLRPEDLDRMIFLESAVNESLRLSSASMNVRVSQEDFEMRLDSQRSVCLRKDDIIAMYPQSMHMDPDIYPQPEVYKFDRFVSDVSESEQGSSRWRRRTEFFKRGQRLHYFLMPFGSGGSKCPGRFFAIRELKQLVCVLLLYCRLELTHLHTHTPPKLDTGRAGLGILPPKTDIDVQYGPYCAGAGEEGRKGQKECRQQNVSEKKELELEEEQNEKNEGVTERNEGMKERFVTHPEE